MEGNNTPSKTSWYREVGTWIGIAAIIIGLGASYYFYRQSIREREPYFIVDPQRTVVIDAAKIKKTPFRVTRLEGEIIEGDISALQFFFWNAGKETINGADYNIKDCEKCKQGDI